MKTPMQKLLERVQEYRDSETNLTVRSRLNSVCVDIVGMLEKEKEVMVGFATKYSHKAFTLTHITEEFEETFNTKER